MIRRRAGWSSGLAGQSRDTFNHFGPLLTVHDEAHRLIKPELGARDAVRGGAGVLWTKARILTPVHDESRANGIQNMCDIRVSGTSSAANRWCEIVITGGGKKNVRGSMAVEDSSGNTILFLEAR